MSCFNDERIKKRRRLVMLWISPFLSFVNGAKWILLVGGKWQADAFLADGGADFLGETSNLILWISYWFILGIFVTIYMQYKDLYVFCQSCWLHPRFPSFYQDVFPHPCFFLLDCTSSYVLSRLTRIVPLLWCLLVVKSFVMLSIQIATIQNRAEACRKVNSRGRNFEENRCWESIVNPRAISSLSRLF